MKDNKAYNIGISQWKYGRQTANTSVSVEQDDCQWYDGQKGHTVVFDRVARSTRTSRDK